MNKGMKKYWDGVGLALTCLTMSLLSVHATEPGINPSDDQYLPYEEGGSFTLTVTPGEAPEPPEEDATCPPWTKDGDPTFQWNSGGVAVMGDATSDTIDVDTSLAVSGEITVVQTQKWKDDDGATDETTITSSPVKVTVFKVELEIEGGDSVCDGASVDVTVKVEPSSAASELSDVDVTIGANGNGTSNPAGVESTIVKNGSDDTKWNVPNARWFGDCNQTADYTLNLSCKIGGKAASDGPYVLTVDASDYCLFGKALLDSYHVGAANIVVSYNSNTQMYEAGFDGQDSLTRFMVTHVVIVNLTSSQYHSMLVAEENFHVGQYKGTTSDIFDDLWNVNAVYQQAYTAGPYVRADAILAQLAANEKLTELLALEMDRSKSVADSRECQSEREAKESVGASYLLSLNCSYPHCN